jgi:hypothetical protein
MNNQAQNNQAQNNLSVVLPLPNLIRAIIVALQHLGIQISAPDIDNNGKSIPFLYPTALNYGARIRENG